MQFVTSRVGGSSSRDGGNGVLSRGSREVAGRSLSLYNEVPEEELTLDEFELFALDRLALLRGMENLRTRGYEGKEFNDRLQAVCDIKTLWYAFKSSFLKYNILI